GRGCLTVAVVFFPPAVVRPPPGAPVDEALGHLPTPRGHARRCPRSIRTPRPFVDRPRGPTPSFPARHRADVAARPADCRTARSPPANHPLVFAAPAALPTAVGTALALSHNIGSGPPSPGDKVVCAAPTAARHPWWPPGPARP